jgi:hypothetical protein
VTYYDVPPLLMLDSSCATYPHDPPHGSRATIAPRTQWRRHQHLRVSGEDEPQWDQEDDTSHLSVMSAGCETPGSCADLPKEKPRIYIPRKLKLLNQPDLDEEFEL